MLALEGEPGIHDLALGENQRVARLNAENLRVALLIERRELAAKLIVEPGVAGAQRQALVADRGLVGGE